MPGLRKLNPREETRGIILAIRKVKGVGKLEKRGPDEGKEGVRGL